MEGASERGFTLLEMVCVLAIVALMAAVLLPSLPRATSRARLEAYALEIATLLKGDRNAAIRRGGSVATAVDAARRRIAAGASGAAVEVADDVAVEAVLPLNCEGRAALSSIRFFADGSSCGGTIALERFRSRFEIQVNWLTGRIEIVSRAIN